MHKHLPLDHVTYFEIQEFIVGNNKIFALSMHTHRFHYYAYILYGRESVVSPSFCTIYLLRIKLNSLTNLLTRICIHADIIMHKIDPIPEKHKIRNSAEPFD